MLPRQSTSGLMAARPRTVSLMSGTSTQVRHFWPFSRRRTMEWSSQLDPGYIRCNRHRYLNTRAKLLRNIRRRSKWDWSGSHGCFFTPKHIRLASHYNGNGRGGFKRWQQDVENQSDKAERERDDYELTTREKIWKQQMERMKKHIHDDPYEAIFGKRFEPFWGPLMPEWVKEESKVPEPEKSEVKSKRNAIKQADNAKPLAKSQRSAAVEYAYASSTTWDSKTNKTKKSEWDSVSDETKHFEYDPISNRMVLIRSPAKAVSQVSGSETAPQVSKSEIVAPPEAEQSSSLRKAIPIPRFPAASVNSVHETFPAATRAESDLGDLTAQSIRASMGRRTNDEASASVETTEDKTASSQPTALDASKSKQVKPVLQTALDRSMQPPILRPAVDRMQPKPARILIDHDDAAAHESTGSGPSTVPESWSQQAELLQSARVERTTSKVPFPDPVPKWVDEMIAKEKAAHEDVAAQHEASRLARSNEMLQAEVDRHKLIMKLHEERFKDAVRGFRANVAHVQTSAQDAKQSSVDQLQSKVDGLEQAEAKYKSKITSLKQELDIAYKQSSRHADEFRDQITKAEKRKLESEQLGEKYKAKLATMRENLDIAYRRSSLHADEFRKQIKDAQSQAEQTGKGAEQRFNESIQKQIDMLQAQLKESSRPKSTRPAKQHEMLRGEGDVCPNVKDFASSKKWYKQPISNAGLESSSVTSSKAQERALVKEIRDIYENAYGVIGQEGQPASSVDAKLGRCLKDVDRQRCYGFHEDGLEKELSRTVETAENKERKKTYQFTHDNLEAELKKPQSEALVKDQHTGVYKFREDGLEAELSKDHTQTSSVPTELEEKPYGFKKDNLEAELAAAPDANTTKRNRASLRQCLTADFKDFHRMLYEVRHGSPIKDVNPIDGTPGVPAVGRYASPTGFVNHDPVFVDETSSKAGKIKREETVFSGTRRVNLPRAFEKASDMKSKRASIRRRKAWRRFVLVSALALGLLGVTAYTEGAALERSQLRMEQAWSKLAKEYEKIGEPGLVEAIEKMQQADSKRRSNLFWKS